MGYFYICDRTDVFNSSKKVMMIIDILYEIMVYVAIGDYTLFSNILLHLFLFVIQVGFMLC